jgi:predicted transcriptional regulator
MQQPVRPKRYSVQVSDELAAELKQAAAEEKRSLAHVIRQALLDWVAGRWANRAGDRAA